jgi:hypothetical protein
MLMVTVVGSQRDPRRDWKPVVASVFKPRSAAPLKFRCCGLQGRSKRAYDRFLRGQAQGLEAGDLPVALRMAGARFSVYRVLRRHELAGVWVDDLISVGEPIWILDQGLELSAPDEFKFGMRIFDAGIFHAGFGIVVPADPEITDFCAQASSRGNRLPVRHSLAATLYADAIWDEWMRVEEEDSSEPAIRVRAAGG